MYILSGISSCLLARCLLSLFCSQHRQKQISRMLSKLNKIDGHGTVAREATPRLVAFFHALWPPHVILTSSYVWGTPRMVDLHFLRWKSELISPSPRADTGGSQAILTLPIRCPSIRIRSGKAMWGARAHGGILGRRTTEYLLLGGGG